MTQQSTSPRILWWYIRSLLPKRHHKLTDYLHRKFRPVIRTGRHILDFAQCQHSIDDFAKHDMLAIEEVAFGCGDKKLSGID